MKKILPAAVAFAALMAAQDNRVIDTFIRRQAHQEHGQEYRDARKVIAADLNGDGLADAAVLYTIEGQNSSNNYIQYLAVFLRTKAGIEPIAHLAAGGKNNRSVELTAVDGSTIHLATMSYGPHDPSCCPSRKGETEYVLQGSMLREREANR